MLILLVYELKQEASGLCTLHERNTNQENADQPIFYQAFG